MRYDCQFSEISVYNERTMSVGYENRNDGDMYHLTVRPLPSIRYISKLRINGPISSHWNRKKFNEVNMQ